MTDRDVKVVVRYFVKRPTVAFVIAAMAAFRDSAFSRAMTFAASFLSAYLVAIVLPYFLTGNSPSAPSSGTACYATGWPHIARSSSG